MLTFASVFALAGLGLGAAGLVLRGRRTARRALPPDRSPRKGDPARGVLYAFTLGMAPWAKESTRLHAFAYLRGIGFHLGIFLAMAALLLRPLWASLPWPALEAVAVAIIVCGLLGAGGAGARLTERNLRRLSTPDDHFAVWLVSAFILATGLALLVDAWIVPSYLIAGVMFLYVPLGKIRHCLYFFFARLYFGKFVGRRGVLPHATAASDTGGVR